MSRNAVSCFVALLSLLLVGCGHPADRKLEQNLFKHEEEFEKLVKMSQQDIKVTRVATDFTWIEDNVQWPRPESELGFSVARWNEYRELFDRLGLPTGFYRPVDELRRNIIFMPASSHGLVTGGSEKGYAYAEQEPKPMVHSIDKSFKDAKSMEPIFKRLKGNWYLYYIWDD